jgi:hypothetical protein
MNKTARIRYTLEGALLTMLILKFLGLNIPWIIVFTPAILPLIVLVGVIIYALLSTAILGNEK